MLIEGRELSSYSIHARDGVVGPVRDFLFEDDSWIVRYVVVNVGSRLNSHPVLLSTAQLRWLSEDSQELAIDLAVERIRLAPSMGFARPALRFEERLLHDYFGWPYYWNFANPDHPTSTESAFALAEPQSHLWGAREILGYGIEATDGPAAQLVELFVNRSSWTVSGLLVDTRDDQLGSNLVSTDRVARVSWDNAAVYLELTRNEVQHEPSMIWWYAAPQVTNPSQT